MASAGIDIGGTQLRVGVFDDAHRLLESYKTANDKSLGARDNMRSLIEFLNKWRGELSAVGIGCPGPLNAAEGRLISPPNLMGWDGFEIVRFVTEETGLPAVLANDAGAACLAEARLGAGAGYETVAYVGVSTGIGGGYAQNGRLFVGAHSGACEIWNMVVNDDTRRHKNANAGSLNEQASGSGLAAAASERYMRDMTARELFELFNNGDIAAREIISRAADTLGRGIANITCTFDPEVIVMGGSVAMFNPLYAEMAVERARKYCIHPDALRVLPAKFGDDAGLLGASLLAER